MDLRTNDNIHYATYMIQSLLREKPPSSQYWMDFFGTTVEILNWSIRKGKLEIDQKFQIYFEQYNAKSSDIGTGAIAGAINALCWVMGYRTYSSLWNYK